MDIMDSLSDPIKNPYLEKMKIHEKERHHPFRYFYDENNNMLPIVAITAFFRNYKESVVMYNEYIENNIPDTKREKLNPYPEH